MRLNRKTFLLLLSFLLVLVFWFSLPKQLFNKPYAAVLLDRQGNLLQARIASDGQWRFEPGYTVPEKFEQAILEFEDKRFYFHPGFDPMAFGRAVYLNLKNQSVVSGGSTISMQVIRLHRNKARTIGEKLIEILLAIRLEIRYSKKEILQLYAAHAPFGGNVVGLQAAAWRYFGRAPEALSWGEAASLAVLPNSPSLVRPDKNRNLLLTKRNKLLKQLKLHGKIDDETYQLALTEPIPKKPLPLPNLCPNLINSLWEARLGSSPKQALLQTTLNREVQKQTNEILERHHQQLKGNGINNAAALIIDIEKNEVLAYAGNVFHPEEPEVESYVDMIPAKRSPGSTLKPLLYAAMLQDGLLLPQSLVADIPTQVSGYMPQNFDLQYDGAVPANKALARSLNVPAVRMLQQYRTERFYFLLKQLGMQSLDKGAAHYGLSLILGGGENSMWEISGVYASLARILNHYGSLSGGFDPGDLQAPQIIATTKKEPQENNIGSNQKPPLTAGAIWHMFKAMQDLVRPGDEQQWTQYISSRRIAWKTGTSYGFRDAWAIGLSSRYLVCVWAGNADGEGRPGLTGASAAAPILFDLIKLIPASAWFATPYDDLQQQLVCTKSGNKATDYCDQRDTQWVVLSKMPQPNCNYHQLIHLDKTGGFRVSSECESVAQMQHRAWFVLPPAMEWYYKSKDANYSSLPPWKPGCEPENNTPVMELIYPKKLSSIYIPKELDGNSGKAIFEVAHRDKNTTLFWHLNGQYIGKTLSFHKMGLSPTAGKHLLLIEDENGNRIELPFEVVRNLPQ